MSEQVEQLQINNNAQMHKLMFDFNIYIAEGSPASETSVAM
jgi:hypothetical protein